MDVIERAGGLDASCASWAIHLDQSTRELLARTPQQLMGNLAALPELVHTCAQGTHAALVVIDRGAVRAAGAMDSLLSALDGTRTAWFDAFTANPTSDQIEAAARAMIAHCAGLVIGIGGGSCLDVAKVGALAASHTQTARRDDGRLRAITRGEVAAHSGTLPVIALPTTSGTGAETTHFSAVYADGRKVSISHPTLRPRGVVLDPDLHMAMPPRLAAVTGLDALCQAMESLWAVGATEESRGFAAAGGALVAENLEESVRNGGHAARTRVMVGAHLAGRAINISKTTAAHALSYELTQRFGLAHGHAVALTLGWVGRSNAHSEDERVKGRVAHAASLLRTDGAGLPSVMRALLERLGLESTLKRAGVPRQSLPALAAAIDSVRLSNNPRRFTMTDVESLLNDAYE